MRACLAVCLGRLTQVLEIIIHEHLPRAHLGTGLALQIAVRREAWGTRPGQNKLILVAGHLAHREVALREQLVDGRHRLLGGGGSGRGCVCRGGLLLLLLFLLLFACVRGE